MITRRDFLKLATDAVLGLGGVLTVGGLLRFFGYAADPPPPAEYNIGPARDLPPRSSTVIPNIPAYVRHDDNGYTALSLKCTHLGCTVEKKGDAFECPCHGSRFDNNGERMSGPATRRLKEFRVEENVDGNLILYVD
jgi:Rieske Fe-S protein